MGVSNLWVLWKESRGSETRISNSRSGGAKEGTSPHLIVENVHCCLHGRIPAQAGVQGFLLSFSCRRVRLRLRLEVLPQGPDDREHLVDKALGHAQLEEALQEVPRHGVKVVDAQALLLDQAGVGSLHAAAAVVVRAAESNRQEACLCAEMVGVTCTGTVIAWVRGLFAYR